jgi:hypothetical protein
MADFVTIPTPFKDAEALLKALADLGFHRVETRPDEEDLIVWPEQGGPLRFERGPAALFLLQLPPAERNQYGPIWITRLKQRYSYHLAGAKLQELGFGPDHATGTGFPAPPDTRSAVQIPRPSGLIDTLLVRLAPNFAQRRYVNNFASQAVTPEVAQVLAGAVVHFQDETARANALKALRQLENQNCINRVCEIWTTTRHPDLERLVLEQGWVATRPLSVKILTALKTERLECLADLKGPDFDTLFSACEDPEADIAEGARVFLWELENKSLLEALGAKWAEGRNPFLEEVVRRKNYLPKKPLETRVLVALKLGQWEQIAGGQTSVVEPLVKASQDRDSQIAGDARQALGQLQKAETRQELCRLVIEQDLPGVEEIVLQAGYLPAETPQRALFFFVTGQWERYESLDFDGRILRAAYETANPALRRRLAEKVRQAGRVAYLSAITGSDYRARAAQMTAEEAQMLVQILAANRDWPKLWPLVFELYPVWAIQAVRLLTEANWQPEREDEQAVMRELIPLARDSELDAEDPARKQLPLAVFRARARTPGRINDLAFSPSRPVVAFATGTGKVLLWNWQKAEKEQVLGPFDHSIGRLAFTPGDHLIWAERTISEDEPCKVYSWKGSGHEVLGLGEHRGSVTVLEPINENLVLSAGRDGAVVLWNLENPYLTRKFKLHDWVRTACLSPDGQQAALVLGREVVFVSLPDFTLQNTSRSLRSAARAVAYLPDGNAVLIAKYSGGLLVLPGWQNPAGKIDRTLPPNLSEVSDVIQGISVLPGKPLVLTAGSEGTLRFTDWEKRQEAGRVRTDSERLTALRVSPDGAFMAVGDSDASFTLWDLRVGELDKLFEQPLAQAKLVHLAALNTVLEDRLELPGTLRAALGFMQTALRHRFRHDIELGEAPSIQFGDFDIEIEG